MAGRMHMTVGLNLLETYPLRNLNGRRPWPFLDSTFGGVANLKRLSMVVKGVTGGTHKVVTWISPWGGRLLTGYGGAIWRAFLVPAVRPPLPYFQKHLAG